MRKRLQKNLLMKSNRKHINLLLEHISELKFFIIGSSVNYHNSDNDLIFYDKCNLRRALEIIHQYCNENSIEIKSDDMIFRSSDLEKKLNFYKEKVLIGQFDLWLSIQSRGRFICNYDSFEFKTKSNFITKSELNTYRLRKKYVLKNLYFFENKLDYLVKELKVLDLRILFLIVFNLIIKTVKKIISPKIIAFYGPDGVGKSSIIESLKLNCFFKNKKIINKHTRYKIFPKIGLLKDKSKSNKFRSYKPLSKTQSSLYAMFIILEAISARFFLIFLRLSGFDFIFFDRYYGEFLIQDRYKNTPLFFKNLIRFFYPKADYNVILDADSSLIFKRKNELTLDQIEIEKEKYAILSKILKTKTTLNNNNLEEVLLKVMNKVNIL